ncbi:MAG: hypothetical protein DRP47_06560 [Candidatus Zixiibacteriota bacterium]|nr:MAG: hypothetical protein DRP47_06560 [candidate division Zixibacteria bacterium]
MNRQYPTYHLSHGFNKKLTLFIERFLAKGFEEFAEEFANIDEFVARAAHGNRSPCEKRLRCTPKEEYLLEAVAFEIYDKLNRRAFNRAKHTIIIMPDCLSMHNPDCEKEDLPTGDECCACTESCQANHIVKLGERYDATVVFSKRKLAEQIEHYSKTKKDIGVIGIACLLMLASGMRTAADVGVPARGVLLNFTGCEHWNEQPYASRFPLSWLRSILEEKYGTGSAQADN